MAGVRGVYGKCKEAFRLPRLAWLKWIFFRMENIPVIENVWHYEFNGFFKGPVIKI
jgi:hypothetical protein